MSTMTFGERLRKARWQHALTQREAAGEIGVPTHTLVRWEVSGVIPTSKPVLAAVERWLADHPDRPVPPRGGSGDRDEALQRLVKDYFRHRAVDIRVEDYDAAVIAGMASAQKFHLTQAEALERVMRYAAEERRQELDAILAHGQMSWPMEDE